MPKDKKGFKKTNTVKTKTKVIGTETYINQSTGEIIDAEVIDIRESTDFNFHKIWLGHILGALDIIGSQKIKVLTYVLDNMNKENMVIATQRIMAQETKTSIQTVSSTIKALQEANILTQVQQGAYRINPDVIFKGYSNSRMNILYKYSSEVDNNKTKKDEKTKDKGVKNESE